MASVVHWLFTFLTSTKVCLSRRYGVKYGAFRRDRDYFYPRETQIYNSVWWRWRFGVLYTCIPCSSLSVSVITGWEAKRLKGCVFSPPPLAGTRRKEGGENTQPVLVHRRLGLNLFQSCFSPPFFIYQFREPPHSPFLFIRSRFGDDDDDGWRAFPRYE